MVVVVRYHLTVVVCLLPHADGLGSPSSLWTITFHATVTAILFIFIGVVAAAAIAITAAPTAANNDYVIVNSVNEYDFAPTASLFVEFWNQYLPHQVTP